MPEPGHKSSLSRQADSMLRRVEERQRRMSRTRAERDRAFWRSVSLLGIVGWSVSVPTLIGIAVGAWIDQKWPGPFSWTLMLLTLGLALGCVHAWVRIRHGQEEDGTK
jgi:ATP synthase protein I